MTFRLADSLPKAVCDELARLSDVDKRRSRLDAVLDQGRGSCALRAAPAAVIVQDALGFFDGDRYKLLAWVVMPNHVHVMIEQIEGYRLNEIIGSWKSFTSKAINALNRSSGVFWAPDYFDRFIRDERHYANAVEYIEQNPVKAGLAPRADDWPYSSAISRLLTS